MENKKFDYTEKVKMEMINIITDICQSFGICEYNDNTSESLFSEDELIDFGIIAYNENTTNLGNSIKYEIDSNLIPREKRLLELAPLFNKVLNNLYKKIAFRDIEPFFSFFKKFDRNFIFDITKIPNYHYKVHYFKEIVPYFMLLFNKINNYNSCYYSLYLDQTISISCEFESAVNELAAEFRIKASEEDKTPTKTILNTLSSKPNFYLPFEKKREIEQYISILEKKIFMNPFINHEISELNSEAKEVTNIYCLTEINNFNFSKLNKKEVFTKKYFKIAFKYIVNKSITVGVIFKKYDLDDFFINGLAGLTLFQYDNLEYWGEKISHILRCDNCHQQVIPYLESYLTSSARSQESSFKCPNCGRTYTYSALLRIYKRNCYNSYN